MKLKYEECRPIEGRQSFAWEIMYESGKRDLFLCVAGNAKAALAMFKPYAREKRFKMLQIDVGHFKIEDTVASYSSDARKLDQSCEIGD